MNQNGEVLLVWTEGTAWQKGPSLAYQLYSRAGEPIVEKFGVKLTGNGLLVEVIACPEAAQLPNSA